MGLKKSIRNTFHTFFHSAAFINSAADFHLHENMYFNSDGGIFLHGNMFCYTLSVLYSIWQYQTSQNDIINLHSISYCSYFLGYVTYKDMKSFSPVILLTISLAGIALCSNSALKMRICSFR